MEKKTVRWGVLGCSGIGKSRTIPGLLSCENAELYAIAGRNEEKLKVYAEPFAPKKLYTDYQALLDDGSSYPIAERRSREIKQSFELTL